MQRLQQLGWLLASLFFLLQLTSCFKYEEVSMGDVQGFEVQDVTSESMVLKATVQIKNPNSYDIKMINSHFDIYIKDKPFAVAKIANQFTIPKNSNEYHEILLSSSYSDVSSSASATFLGMLLSGQRKVPMKVDGYVKAKVFIFKKKHHIDFEEEIDIRELMGQ